LHQNTDKSGLPTYEYDANHNCRYTFIGEPSREALSYGSPSLNWKVRVFGTPCIPTSINQTSPSRLYVISVRAFLKKSFFSAGKPEIFVERVYYCCSLSLFTHLFLVTFYQQGFGLRCFVHIFVITHSFKHADS